MWGAPPLLIGSIGLNRFAIRKPCSRITVSMRAAQESVECHTDTCVHDPAMYGLHSSDMHVIKLATCKQMTTAVVVHPLAVQGTRYTMNAPCASGPRSNEHTHATPLSS